MTSEIHLTLIQPHVIGIPVLHTGSVLNIISINANGLRTQLKRDLLEKLLIDLQAGVGIITETHLRKPDLAWIRYPNYCYTRDSFLHMLDCYHLTESVQRGPEVIPFLLRMARTTKRKPGHPPFPYLEPLSALTRQQDAAHPQQRNQSPARSVSTQARSD